jgi:hypothetical protein
MEDVISAAKAEFTRANQRVAKCLATTPDDKLNWSPAPTSRTIVQQVAHVAMAVDGIQGMLVGKPFEFASIADMDASIRAAEKEFTSREQVQALLDEKSAAYLAWLDTLTPEQIASTVHLPFGAMPMAVAITIMADHYRGHAYQIDYIQTMYGDMDWHM